MPKGVHLPRVTLACARCGAAFSRVGSDHDRIYCSWECAKPRRDAQAARPCLCCGALFVPRSHHGQRYCSASCGRRHFNDQRRKANRAGGHFADYREAKAVLLGQVRACQACGWTDEPAILELHHLDRDRRNNHLSNLCVLCPTCHTWEHYRAGTGQFANNLGRR